MNGHVVVFCEVRARRADDVGSPLEGVSETKAARPRVLAARWVEVHDLHPADVRLDLV